MGLFTGGVKNQTSTTQVTPWAPQGEQLQSIWSDMNALKDQPLKYFQGQGYVDKSGATQAGQDYLTAYANGASQDLFGQTTGKVPYMLNAYDVNNNPYAQQWMSAAVQPLYDNLTEQVMPEIRSGARMAGQGGSTRQGVAEGLAVGKTARAAGETTANIANSAYNTGMNAALQTMQMTPQMMQAGAIPGQLLEGVGAIDEQYAAAKLQDEINRWDFAQMEPWQRLQMQQGLVQGNYGGTTTATTPVSTPSMFSKIAGGVAMGAGLSKMGLGPLGWALGLGAGMGG